MLRTGKLPYGKWVKGNCRIWQWQLPKDTIIIFDECQRGKGMNSQNAKMMWTAKPYYTLCLSATAAKDPTEMKALGYLLGMHSLRDFWQWARRNGCVQGTFGGLVFNGTDKNIDKLHREIFPDHGSGLTYQDLAAYFKETEIITTPLDFGPEVKQAYSEMASELDELAKRASGDSTQADDLTIRLRARQKVELLKVPYMVDFAYDLLAQGRSVVFFVNYTQTLLALKERLSSAYNVGIVAGFDTKNRQTYIDQFARDELRVMLCNSKAGGVSINLHDLRGQYPRAAIISPDDNEKDIIQDMGRIHRAAGKTPTQQFIMFAAGTVEEEVRENCEKKIKQIGIFNEGIDNTSPI